MSGLSALILNKSEVTIMSSFRKNNLQRLMKLHEKTPDCVIYFLAGSLPGAAILHLRQLSLFCMICHLKDDILNSLAIKLLVDAKPGAHSWFQQIREICIQYELPHPLSLLESPPPKLQFKKFCKDKVHEYWRSKLSLHASSLPSLQYLKPDFLSLKNPHPIWTSLDGNPYQAKAAKVQALFLSGRYRTNRFCRFWSATNKEGYCELKTCKDLNIIEDLEHIILYCNGLCETRRRLLSFTTDFIADKPILQPIIDAYLFSSDSNTTMQFLLDCSLLPLVIQAKQKYGPSIHQTLFKITRTWCRSLHRDRLKCLGRYISS